MPNSHSFKTTDQNVLIVEDDFAIRECLAEILASEGFRVEKAANGREALDYLRSQPVAPRAIILDLMMPVMNGYEFRERQLKDERLAGIPVIVISAQSNFESDRDHLQAASYIAKPIDLDVFLSVLDSVCTS